MQQPLIWLNNKFDRSPGELVRVTPPSWAPLQNRLLDISYGMGRMNLILQDESDAAQGAAIALPMTDFPTGVMRGRFHPNTGDLYTCGIAVWALNKIQDGGIYRVRRTSSAMNLPIAWKTAKGSLTITYSDPIDRITAEDIRQHTLKVWDLLRSANYGSKHEKEHAVSITKGTLAGDGRTLTLTISDLAPTRGLEL